MDCTVSVEACSEAWYNGRPTVIIVLPNPCHHRHIAVSLSEAILIKVPQLLEFCLLVKTSSLSHNIAVEKNDDIKHVMEHYFTQNLHDKEINQKRGNSISDMVDTLSWCKT